MYAGATQCGSDILATAFFTMELAGDLHAGAPGAAEPRDIIAAR
jgi:hypothetical protein